MLTLVLDFEEITLHPLLCYNLSVLARHTIQRTQLVPLAQAKTLLGKFLLPYSEYSTIVVLRLPNEHPQRLSRIAEAIAAVATEPKLNVELIVGVTERPALWSQLPHVNHFIAMGRSGTIRATLSAIRMAASLMAPRAMIEATSDELAVCLGSATTPAYLFHGEWSREQSTFLLHPDWVTPAIRSATSCLIVNEGRAGSPRMARDLIESWRALCPNLKQLVCSITDGFFEPLSPPMGLREDSQRIAAFCCLATGDPFGHGENLKTHELTSDPNAI